MSRNNIAERRAYIKSLIDAGIAIDIRGIAKQWNSSPPAIVVDISMVNGLGDPYRAHPTKKQNQRAARMGAEGELTTSGWNNILKDCNYACVICGSTKDIVIDHIIPLSKGGTNTLDNVQPLCRSCNSSKGNRLSAASRENGKLGGRPTYEEKARDRVAKSPRLSAYQDEILHDDFCTADHWKWVATATIDEIVGWADAVRDAAES